MQAGVVVVIVVMEEEQVVVEAAGGYSPSMRTAEELLASEARTTVQRRTVRRHLQGGNHGLLLMLCQPMKVTSDFIKDNNNDKFDYSKDVAMHRRPHEGGGRDRAKKGGVGGKCAIPSEEGSMLLDGRLAPPPTCHHDNQQGGCTKSK